MYRNLFLFIFHLFICISFLLTSCISSKYSNKVNASKVNLSVTEKKDVIDYTKIEKKTIPLDYAMRNEKQRGLDPLSIFGGAVSLATQGIKTIIAADKKNILLRTVIQKETSISTINSLIKDHLIPWACSLMDLHSCVLSKIRKKGIPQCMLSLNRI